MANENRIIGLSENTSPVDVDYVVTDHESNGTKKLSFKNLIKKIIGSTSISSIGDGTVTGAISKLNTDLAVGAGFRVYVYKNASSISIPVPYGVDHDHFGSFLIFNQNQAQTQHTLAIINTDGTNTVISGKYTFTASVSGTTLTVVPSERIWGYTVVIGCYT